MLSNMARNLIMAATAAHLMLSTCCSPITSFNSKALFSSLNAIRDVNVVQSQSGLKSSLFDVIDGKKSLLVFLTHLGDLSSWELAQKLVYYAPKLESAGVNLITVAPGATMTHAAEFCLKTGLPIETLFLDFEAASYDALKFEKGFMPNAKISPYLKLLPMLMGIQSEGTIAEVLRGYVGDKTAPSGWIKSTLRCVSVLPPSQSNLQGNLISQIYTIFQQYRLVEQDRFNVLGTDYQVTLMTKYHMRKMTFL
jgi:AhpC/TSA antioxidant enzyme